MFHANTGLAWFWKKMVHSTIYHVWLKTLTGKLFLCSLKLLFLQNLFGFTRKSCYKEQTFLNEKNLPKYPTRCAESTYCKRSNRKNYLKKIIVEEYFYFTVWFLLNHSPKFNFLVYSTPIKSTDRVCFRTWIS